MWVRCLFLFHRFSSFLSDEARKATELSLRPTLDFPPSTRRVGNLELSQYRNREPNSYPLKAEQFELSSPELSMQCNATFLYPFISVFFSISISLTFLELKPKSQIPLSNSRVDPPFRRQISPRQSISTQRFFHVARQASLALNPKTYGLSPPSPLTKRITSSLNFPSGFSFFSICLDSGQGMEEQISATSFHFGSLILVSVFAGL